MKFIFFFIFNWMIFCLLSCKTQQNFSRDVNSKFEIRDNLIVYDLLELDSRFIIYPSAFITTKGNGKLVIKEPITILGKRQVFDTDINIEFKQFTISEIYPEWFGAKGYDENDDTKSFKKVLEVAKEYPNSINIMVSVGVFKISETLVVACESGNVKSINLIGSSMSTSSQNGSSFVWNGTDNLSMIKIQNINLSQIKNIDFHGKDRVKHNLELRPFVNQILISNCTFKGCIDKESSNINMNQGNNTQVSEIQIENCTFHGVPSNNNSFLSESAINGGLANTKNFYIKNCSFLGYNKAAINIEISDIMTVENCSFAFNDIDIVCLLCNSFIKSNYSERSNAFFKSTSSSNLSFTTMIGNFFDGFPKDGYVIRDGAGSLTLLNNNFGGAGEENEKNNIKWEHLPFNPIFSIGNFYNNTSKDNSPFYERSNNKKETDIFSKGDFGGKSGGRKNSIKNN